ncbi:MAG: hypothetical protein H7A23_22100 [Leptospiraceae bacterium]|nr:hypothetical protein [Leptospiraceae bacterium]MCP5497254.1 hypothetical protein [Leptospiraceae bacterium]
MVYIVTALYVEALPIINWFHLVKTNSTSKFKIYNNEKIQLIISGTGKVKSAIATTYLLSQQENHNLKDDSVILNIGICGSKNKNFDLGTMFLVHKIVDFANQRTYFPNIPPDNQLSKAAITTADKAVISDSEAIQTDLVDMEASGFFQASSLFMENKNIALLKIVSDHLSDKKLSKEDVYEWIYSNLGHIK